MRFWRKKKSEPIIIPAIEKPERRQLNSLGLDSTHDYSMRYAACMERSFRRTHADLKLSGDTSIAMDEQMKAVMDSNIQEVKSFTGANQGFLPIHVLEWYSSQGFIGWQTSAILAQNWFVNKVCKMPGLDAVRHGWERSVNDGVEVDTAIFDRLRKLDKKFKLKSNLAEHYKFSRVFGIRHTLFIVDGIDYEAPFNPDGVREGAYQGMTQIDPYWLAPMFSLEDAADPMSQNFYNPTWWMIKGKKYHRSHFVISRNGNELADLLKPSYFYGGVSTVQMIYDRVYAAERVANEAPLLAMTKRLFTLTTDTDKAMTNLDVFKAKLTEWMALLNNFGLKVLGTAEKVDQIDTSLTEFNETIRTQYDIACAAAEVPVTKIMETSPKGGLGSEGTYEMNSYHEKLEDIQENELSPIIDRHTLLCQRSFGLMPEINFETQWLPVDSVSAKDQADINLIKAQTDAQLITCGAVDGMDVRKRIIKDRDSGFNGIEEEIEGMNLIDEGDPAGGGESNDPE